MSAATGTSGPSLSVRPLGLEDKAAWLPLWRGYQAFYGVDLAASTDAAFARMVDPSEPTFGALAWRDGEAVGLVHFIAHRTNWSVADSCYLQDLFVDPRLRGGGAGRALIAHVYAVAQDEGWAEVHWLTHGSNSTAQRLYDELAERTGFIDYTWVRPAG